jgi:hypothetical protein
MTVIGWTGELAGQLGIEFAEDLDQLRADAGRLIAVYGAAQLCQLFGWVGLSNWACAQRTDGCGTGTVNSPFRTNTILWASLFVVLRE